MQGGSYAWKGGIPGFGSGEGPTAGDVPTHKVTIYNKYQDRTFELEVPEDRCVTRGPKAGSGRH